MPIFFYTVSLLDAMEKMLKKYPPGHPRFIFTFGKVLKKAKGIRERGEVLWRAQM